MKMGFSTLGCPAWPYEIILKRASEYGFNGFEVRGILGEMDLLKVPEFKPTQRAETLRQHHDPLPQRQRHCLSRGQDQPL